MRRVYDPVMGRELDRILHRGYILLHRDEVRAYVLSYVRESKGVGAEKIAQLMSVHYSGIGERTIRSILNEELSSCKRNPTFRNKAPLATVKADRPMYHHQVDLVDFSGNTCMKDCTEYKYVLSLIDVFTRFLWLRALPDKAACTVAKELYHIYLEFGPPVILQSDQGSEFKGVVKLLCSHCGTRLIHGRPYHPQSQGKVRNSFF